MFLKHSQRGLSHRLTVIGIPTHLIKPFIWEIDKWITHSGLQWTIDRCKSIKVDLIRRKSGLPPLTWIRKNHYGDVGGIIGALFRWSDLSDKHFNKVLQALQIYTYFTFEETSVSQKRKFLKSVKAPNIPIPFKLTADISTAAKRLLKNRRVKIDREKPIHLITYSGSPSKKAPVPLEEKTVVQSTALDKELDWFFTDEGTSFYLRYKDLYDPIFYGLKEFREQVLGSFMDFTSLLDFDEEGIPFDPSSIRGGQVHFLQEPGGKLRSVASPYRSHQCALNPLGKTLFNLIKKIPWDCTHDQSKAHPIVQHALNHNKTVHSVDLSAATDYFPLELQVIVLESIFGKIPDIKLFQDISRSTWSSPIGDVQWTQGQPLGLYPSFAAFTLTHGILLYSLNGNRWDKDFYVVGDDVVILDDTLYQSYISTLQTLGCPWSPDKSISSSKLSEFAGKIILSDKIIPQYKWRKIHNENFIDICRNLGRKSRSLLTQRQRKIFDKIAHLVEPFGLNFSKEGSNYVSMYLDTLPYLSEEKVLGSLTGLTGLINNHIFKSSQDFEVFCSAEEISDILSIFDEKIKRAFHHTIFSNLISNKIDFAKAVDDLPEALGLEPILPLKQVIPFKQSLIERYERLTSV